MLLEDEQYVIKWLSQYGPLPKIQVIRLLKDKPVRTAEKIIRNLKRQMKIADVGGGYYVGLDEMCKPDPRIITAIWVLLQFEHVEPQNHYPAIYPSQVFFLKENMGYEILVLNDGERHLTRLLQPQEELKYIFVVPNLSMVGTFHIPDVPCIYATVSFDGEQEEPNVTFYSEEVAENGCEKKSIWKSAAESK